MTMACRSAAGLMLLALVVTPLVAQTAESLIAEHIEALGGRRSLLAVRTVRGTGTLTTEHDAQGVAFVQEQMRPDKLRFEHAIEGGVLIKATSGSISWELETGEARRLSQVPAQQSERYLRQARIDGPLAGAFLAARPITLLGRTTLGERTVYKLEVTYEDGDFAHLYLDAESHLLVRIEDHWKIRDQTIEIGVELGDYRPVAGILFPHRVMQRTSQGWRRFDFEKIEANVEIDPSRFEMPG